MLIYLTKLKNSNQYCHNVNTKNYVLKSQDILFLINKHIYLMKWNQINKPLEWTESSTSLDLIPQYFSKVQRSGLICQYKYLLFSITRNTCFPELIIDPKQKESARYHSQREHALYGYNYKAALTTLLSGVTTECMNRRTTVEQMAITTCKLTRL
jgi:hypothetical protein